MEILLGSVLDINTVPDYGMKKIKKEPVNFF